MNNNQEEVIEFLKPRDAVRKRWGMYISSNDTASILLRECIDNSMDEISAGFGDTILISNNLNGFCFVADYGRGIPISMSKDQPNRTQTDLAVTELHAGSKFDSTDVSRVGQNGLGLSITNFLSSEFYILSKITESNYDKSIPKVKEIWEQAGPRSKKDLFYIIGFNQGIQIIETAGKLKDLEKNIFKTKGYISIPSGCSTITLFRADPEIFESTEAEIPIKNLSYFQLIQEKFYKRKVNVVVDGEIMQSLFKPYQFEVLRTIVPKDVSMNKQVGMYITFEIDPTFGPKIETGSVNGLEVNQGQHINIAETLFKTALKDYFKIKHSYLDNGLRMCVITLAGETVFDSQTKVRLKQISKVKQTDFVEVAKDIQKVFKKNQDYWENYVAKLDQIAESFQNIGAIEKVKKLISSNSGVNFYRSKNDIAPGFVDATCPDRSRCSLFICEGLSPGSSLVNARTSNEIGVLPLRGKILASQNKSADQIMDNREIYSIFSAIRLGIDAENVTKGCKTREEAWEAIKKNSRYSKICIAVDPDPDGYFIANSLLYMFSKFARFMIDFGLIYLVEVPVFIQTINGIENYYYPSDPVHPGTILPINMDLTKKYTHIKGLGSLTKSQVQMAFYNPPTRRLMQVTSDNIDRAMQLTENIIERKRFLYECGVLSNPYNFKDII